MSIVTLSMALLAFAPNATSDDAAKLRSTIAPYLQCSQKFNTDWAGLKIKSERADDVADGGDDKQRADFFWEANQNAREARSELGKLSTTIEDSCQRSKFEKLLKLEVTKLRPEYRPMDISAFATDLFNSFVRIDRDIAYFKAGHAAVPLVIMSPPATAGSK